MNKLIVIILAAIFLKGCSTAAYVSKTVDIYTPSTYSKIITETGDVHELARGFIESLTFTEVDGKSLFGLTHVWGLNEINVEPGSHRVKVRYDYLGASSFGCLELESEAGVNYILRYQYQNRESYFWFETVSGEISGKPCEPG